MENVKEKLIGFWECNKWIHPVGGEVVSSMHSTSAFERIELMRDGKVDLSWITGTNVQREAYGNYRWSLADNPDEEGNIVLLLNNKPHFSVVSVDLKSLVTKSHPNKYLHYYSKR